MIPLIPLSFDYGCEIMFPIGEAQVSGIILNAGQIMGLVFIIIAQSVFDLSSDNKDSAFNTMFMVNLILLLCCLTYCFFNSPLKRTKLEQSQNSLLSSESFK